LFSDISNVGAGAVIVMSDVRLLPDTENERDGDTLPTGTLPKSRYVGDTAITGSLFTVNV
jgi:hypothetical protein